MRLDAHFGRRPDGHEERGGFWVGQIYPHFFEDEETDMPRAPPALHQPAFSSPPGLIFDGVANLTDIPRRVACTLTVFDRCEIPASQA